MPARDLVHNAVKSALQKDGWTITHDPLSIDLTDGQLQIDLGAERLIAAQKQDERLRSKSKVLWLPLLFQNFIPLWVNFSIIELPLK